MSGSARNGDQSDRTEDVSGSGLSERRAQLDRALEGRREADEIAERKSRSGSSGYGQAMKLSSEFIAGIVVGGGIGWVVDQWLGTMPFGLVVFLLLGFAAGVLNVLRSVGYVAEPDNKLHRDDERENGSE